MAISSFNSWAKWTSQGNPINDPLNNTLRVDDPNNLLTYEYCDGETTEECTVSLWLTGITRQDYNDGNSHTDFRQRMAVSASTVVTSDMTVNAKVWIRQESTSGGGFDWYQSNSYSWIIKAGTDHTIDSGTGTSLFPIELYTDYGSFNTSDQFSFVLEDQWQNISCAAPPPECELEITGVTTSNPTFQGGSDGSITVYVSGSTGTTQYSINNGSLQTSNTFSGLAAGLYDIQAEEGSCYDVTGATLLDGEFRTGDFSVTEPNDYLAVENPIMTTLQTAVNSATGLQAISTLEVDSNLANNYRVRFNLTSPAAYDVTFTARDFPNRDSYFTTPTLRNRAGDDIGVNTDEENASTLADVIQSDINLSRWYFVDVSGTTVTLTSKEESSSLTLNSSNIEILDDSGASATDGITLTTVQVGVDEFQGSMVDQYSLYTDIYIGDGKLEYGDDLSSGTYNNYTDLELPFSQDNIHQFDASQVMKSFVYTPKPDYTFTGFTRISTMLRNFYVRYGESYPLVANENTKKKRSKGQTDYKWCINSALDWEDANDMAYYFTGQSTNPWQENRLFLTNAPNPLDIQRNQTNFLYFVLQKDVGERISLVGGIKYYDGTQEGVEFFEIASGTTNVGGVYMLNVSYDTLGLEAYENSGNTKIKEVQFAVYTGPEGSYTGIMTEFRNYRFEIDEMPRKFGVAFENKLGGYDTFDFIGERDETIDRKAKTYTVPREIRDDGSSPEGFKNLSTYDTKVTKKITVNSGWIDEDHFDWLIELMSSNNIYSYTEPYQNYLNVTGTKYTKSSLDDLFELEVTFLATIYENNITV